MVGTIGGTAIAYRTHWHERRATLTSARRRLDTELVRRGLAPTRRQAQELVLAGRVTVAGAPADKSGRLVAAGEPLIVLGPPPRYVGRGGTKLEAALHRFDVDVTGARCLDAGASTGGFTDCLLQHGAAEVWAVDVGHGQLHPRIRHDERVTVRERLNIRDAGPESLGGCFDVVVADLSFISLTTVAAALVRCTRERGRLIVLVKPQFEAGRRQVSAGRGVITDPVLWRAAVRSVAGAFAAEGATPLGVVRSPLTGGDGNVEFLLHAVRDAGPVGTAGSGPGAGFDAALDAALADAVGGREPAEPVVRDGGEG